MPLRHHPIVCAVQREIMAFMPDVIQSCVLPKGDDSISTPYIVWPCVHSKGEYNISCLRSSERVSYPMDMMACHTRRGFTLYILFKGDNGMPCPIFADRVWWPRFMSACHARRSSIVYVFQGKWSHFRIDGDDRILGLMLFNRLCSPMAMIVCNA